MPEADGDVFVQLSEREPEVAVSASLFLIVGMRGVVVPAYEDFTGLPLGLEGLLFIEYLSAGRTATVGAAVEAVEHRLGHDASALFGLAEELRRRRLLVDSAGPAVEAPGAMGYGTAEPVEDDINLVFSIPSLLAIGPDGFEYVDHDGRVVIRLDAIELHAASGFCTASTVAESYTAHRTEAGEVALSEEAFGDLAARLLAAGLVAPFNSEHPQFERAAENRRRRIEQDGRRTRVRDAEAARVEEADTRNRELAARTGRVRMPVVPVDTHWMLPPAALGYLIAYATAYDGGRLNDSYAFTPRFYYTDADLVRAAQEPGIFLLSNYIWNIERNLEFSLKIKAACPESITIHGGPSTPKYAEDAEKFFADHPDVDVVVRGEGEETFAEILAALEPSARSGTIDLSALRDVRGLGYRTPQGFQRTEDRDRIADLDTIPSPLLTGLFDGFIAGPALNVILETNRGCPYGCTFCDWGSATLSRIRQFDIDRVFAELEWMGQNQIYNVALADANFGIFKRDVDIAEKIVEVKAKYGFPQVIGPNYAKNTVKHLRPIIEIFADAGILAEGKVSLQSMDAGTLKAIRRRNIKTEKYNQLATEFQENHLPMSVDLMMGLPGATVASFRDDLQGVINRDVLAAIHETRLLPNSPMNAADYRAEHGIRARVGEVLKETNSYDRDDWKEMSHLRVTAYIFDTAGASRHVSKYVRHETGQREIDFYAQLIRDVLADSERWPSLAFAVRAVVNRMLPPGSWRRFVDELHDYLVQRCGVPDDDALATVLAVQHAVLPTNGRSFPHHLELAHDYVAWHQAVLDVRTNGHHDDWHELVPPLREYPSGELDVEDPDDVCRTALGQHMDMFLQRHVAWELVSPVSRPRIDMVAPAAG
ncbi:MAG: radical SAM protein [Acidimicrobiia bacterium]|nr:radical SAM protein [Acidimicrobiia bacterium]MDH5237047.1 radical SAM protein [Acidimicrobiia bacterium]